MDELTRVVDYLPQAAVPVTVLLGLVTAALMGNILLALHRDALDMAESADLARLTAALPADLRPGRHQFGWAVGTDAQRALWSDATPARTVADTQAWDTTELWQALRADQPTMAGAR